MDAAKSYGLGCLDGSLDLRAKLGVVEMLEHPQAPQADPRRAVAPGSHKLRFIRQIVLSAGLERTQVAPVSHLGRKERPLVADRIQRRRAEAHFAAGYRQIEERRRDP